MDRERDSSSQGSREIEGNLTERLRNVLMDQSEGDLLMNNRNGVEIGFIRWLRALDLQIIGACRADERLKPLLKFDISNGFAEDRLLNQFAQHFEASEVGMLARCLCAPLISIRAGKVNKQGKLLCPSAVRGHLNLTLLPSSNLRISFVGDDGVTERVAVVSSSSEVLIEEILVDSSGRTFQITVPDYQVFYFWCSEKSKLLGMELLAKMKDLIRRKPSLSDLTGISEPRLQSFASHLRTYLLTSSDSPETSTLVSTEPPTALMQTHPLQKPSPSSSKRRPAPQHFLSPKPIPFKGKNSSKEKPIQHANQCEETNITQPELPITSTPSLEFPPPPEIVPPKSMFSPYYCWCPLPPSSSLHLNSTITLPPLSSLLSSSRPGPPQVVSKSPFDVPNLPIATLPASTHISTFAPFMSDPIVHTPVIDVCSSGQLYLVSAEPTMTSPVSPYMQSTESAAEKSARETLRMLMASTPYTCFKKNSNGHILPGFLSNLEDVSPTFSARGNGVEGHNLAQHSEGNARSLSRYVDRNGEVEETNIVKNTVGCESESESVDEVDLMNNSENN